MRELPSTSHERPLVASRVISQPSPPIGSPSIARPHSDAEARIALTWLTRLRWLALGGQLTALCLASFWLVLPWQLVLPILAIAVLTNVLLLTYRRRAASVLPQVLPCVLMLDVLLLTAMLMVTGGRDNPFSVIYIVHVAMAVVIVTPRWAWTIAAVALLSYTILLPLHLPFQWITQQPRGLLPSGQWLALAVSAGVITYFISRLRDELRVRDEALSAMRETMVRSERLASLATLAAGAAHGLGTPLATIAVVATELEADWRKQQPDDQALDDIRLIRSEVDRCRRILDRMNVENLQRPDEPPTTLTLDQLIHDIQQSLSTPQATALGIVQDATMRHLTVPRHALVQAVQILIQNAFDAATAGDSQVSLTLRNETEDFIIEVRDNGPGMSMEQLEHVGEPFFTTKSPQRSMGLGLFLARLVAERLRGSLSLRSVVGQGTVATLKFPIHWYQQPPSQPS